MSNNEHQHINIAEVVVGLAVEGPFDYAVQESMKANIRIGQRVSVLFNRRRLVGYVVGFKNKSTFKKLNPLLELLDREPSLTERQMQLAKKISAHYGCSLGEALEIQIPRYQRQNKVLPLDKFTETTNNGSHSTSLLICDPERKQGWEKIYQQINAAVDHKQKIIFLVPEASIIPAVEQKIQQQCKVNMTVIDRTLTDKQEWLRWCDVRKGIFDVVIGTRSAVFLPMPNLSTMIIYDEEHASYREEQTPYYRVHQIAKFRATIEGCSLVFHSTAPLAETWHAANGKTWERHLFNPTSYSEFQPVDMTNYNPRKTSILSFPLQNAITKTIEQQGRVILFMNRIGFNTMTRCNQCGFTINCDHCSSMMVFMNTKNKLICTHCQAEKNKPEICPSCKGKYIRSMGVGIERLQSEVKRYYPYLKVECFDRTSPHFPKSANIVIATQALFREREHLKADLVAVMNLDAELTRVNFRSAQQTFSLLVSLRFIAVKKLLVQTRLIDSYCIDAVKKMNFTKFYKEELALRKELALPPYRHMIAVALRGANEEDVHAMGEEINQALMNNQPEEMELSDLHADLMPKLRDKYRYIIMLKAKSIAKTLPWVKENIKTVKKKKNVILTVSVD